jgi:parallel beta-helix repeat protein
MDRKTWTWSLLVVSLLMSVWSASGWAQMPKFADTEIAVDARAAGVYDFQGQEIGCGPDQRLGLAVANGATVRNLKIGAGCQVGVAVLPSDGLVTHSRVEGQPAVVLSHITAQAFSVCFWDGGSFSLYESNTATNCTIGFYVAGHDNTLRQNTVINSSGKGILLVGHANLVENNTITSTLLPKQGRGIHVAARVPNISPTYAYFQLEELAQANVLRGNHVSGYYTDIMDYTRKQCNDPYDWANTWIDNIFATKQPACLD